MESLSKDMIRSTSKTQYKQMSIYWRCLQIVFQNFILLCIGDELLNIGWNIVIQLLVWLSAFNVLSYRSDQQVFCLGFLLFLCSSICLDCIASKSRKQKQASPLSSL